MSAWLDPLRAALDDAPGRSRSSSATTTPAGRDDRLVGAARRLRRRAAAARPGRDPGSRSTPRLARRAARARGRRRPLGAAPARLRAREPRAPRGASASSGRTARRARAAAPTSPTGGARCSSCSGPRRADLHAAVEPLHERHGRVPGRARVRGAVARPHAPRRSAWPACSSCRSHVDWFAQAQGRRLHARELGELLAARARRGRAGRRDAAPRRDGRGDVAAHATSCSTLLARHGRPAACRWPRVLEATPRGAAHERAIVTGCAGFIGSHLCERLLAEGWQRARHRRLHALLRPRRQGGEPRRLARRAPASTLVEADLATADLEPLLAGAPTSSSTSPPSRACARASARASPTTRATTCSRPSACSRPPAPRAARASCGRRPRRSTATPPRYPCREDVTPTRPRSPYGVTKRACEDLAAVYARRAASSRRPALLHRLRPAPAPRHGDAAALRGAARRRAVPALRRRLPVARLHPRLRRRRRHAPRRRSPTARPPSTTSAAATRRRWPRSSRCSRTSPAGRPCSTAAPPRRGDVRRTRADTSRARSRPRLAAARWGCAKACAASSTGCPPAARRSLPRRRCRKPRDDSPRVDVMSTWG